MKIVSSKSNPTLPMSYWVCIKKTFFSIWLSVGLFTQIILVILGQKSWIEVLNSKIDQRYQYLLLLFAILLCISIPLAILLKKNGFGRFLKLLKLEFPANFLKKTFEFLAGVFFALLIQSIIFKDNLINISLALLFTLIFFNTAVYLFYMVDHEFKYREREITYRK